MTGEVEWSATSKGRGAANDGVRRSRGSAQHDEGRTHGGEGARWDGVGPTDASLKKRHSRRRCRSRLRNQWIRINAVRYFWERRTLRSERFQYLYSQFHDKFGAVYTRIIIRNCTFRPRLVTTG
jgi:hypothetical protein